LSGGHGSRCSPYSSPPASRACPIPQILGRTFRWTFSAARQTDPSTTDLVGDTLTPGGANGSPGCVRLISDSACGEDARSVEYTVYPVTVGVAAASPGSRGALSWTSRQLTTRCYSLYSPSWRNHGLTARTR